MQKSAGAAFPGILRKEQEQTHIKLATGIEGRESTYPQLDLASMHRGRVGFREVRDMQLHRAPW